MGAGDRQRVEIGATLMFSSPGRGRAGNPSLRRGQRLEPDTHTAPEHRGTQAHRRTDTQTHRRCTGTQTQRHTDTQTAQAKPAHTTLSTHMSVSIYAIGMTYVRDRTKGTGLTFILTQPNTKLGDSFKEHD